MEGVKELFKEDQMIQFRQVSTDAKQSLRSGLSRSVRGKVQRNA
jgi:hypothetical protein